jgi:hypothetical protein
MTRPAVSDVQMRTEQDRLSDGDLNAVSGGRETFCDRPTDKVVRAGGVVLTGSQVLVAGRPS